MKRLLPDTWTLHDVARSACEDGLMLNNCTPTVRALVQKLKIKPVGYGLDPKSGRGRVGYYDPSVRDVAVVEFCRQNPEVLDRARRLVAAADRAGC